MIFHRASYAARTCKRNIEMTPLCKIEVTHPRVLGSREVRRGGVVAEQAGVHAASSDLSSRAPRACPVGDAFPGIVAHVGRLLAKLPGILSWSSISRGSEGRYSTCSF